MIFNEGTNKLYVAGDHSTIAVLDGSTNKRIGAITLLNVSDAVQQMFENPTTKRVYVQTLTTLSVIDSTTDTVLQTITGPGEFLSAAYLSALDRLYVVVFDGTPNFEIAIRDGASLNQVGVLASGVNAFDGSIFPEIPTNLVAVPGTNRIFGWWAPAGVNTVTLFWWWDGATNTLIDKSDCSGALCLKVIDGSLQRFMVNPLDNRVWGSAIFQLTTVAGGGDEAGSGPVPFPLSTALAPIDAPLPQAVGSFIVGGGFTPLAFDPSGKIVGSATCVPTTATPVASQDPCLGLPNGLYAADSATPLGTKATLIDLNHFVGGTGVCIGVPLGYDPSLGYAYWSCNGSGNGAVGKIGIVKYDLTQTPDTSFFPPRIVGQWLTDFPTRALNFLSAIGAVTYEPAMRRAFFLNPPDNSVVAVDPVGSKLSTELLSSRAGQVVVNPTTNTVVVAEDTAAEITTVNATTNTVTALHIPVADGPFIDVNPSTNQLVVAGSADAYHDQNHTLDAFLYDGSGTTLLNSLSAAAVGGIILDPATLTGQGVTVNPATNRAYFLDQSAWYVVDLATGNRIFTGKDFTGTDFAGALLPNPCQFSGLAVDTKANRYYVVGQCPASAAGNFTIGAFDGATNMPINTATLANFTTGSGGGWGRIAVNPNTNRLYLELLTTTTSATNLNGPTTTTMVVTYDATTLTRLGMPMTASGGPMLVSFPLAINTATNRVYATVSSSTSATATPELVLLDGGVDPFGRTDVVIGQQPLSVRAIGINETTGRAYVASDTLLALPGQIISHEPGLNVFQEPPVPAKFTLSGRVTENGAALTGISIAISASNGEGTTVTTDAAGAYSLGGLVAGTYTINPTTRGFAYTPATQSVTISTANASGINFTAVPAYHVSGFVLDGNGNGIPLQSVSNPQINPGITDASGAFTLNDVVPGTYLLLIGNVDAPCCFLPETVTVTNADVTGVIFKELPPVVITGLTFNPAMIGAGVVSTGTLTLASPAPPGGIVVNLLDANSKAVKAPATLTIPEGVAGITFTVQGNGVSATTTVNFTAQYSGIFSPHTATVANAALTVAPTDSLKVTSATWSQSTHLLKVTATSTNAQATLTVILSSTKQPLGTMVNNGGGTFSFQMQFDAGIPASVNITSNLGGSTGQGVAIVP